eukprot:6649113-Prymnesium_polylepis.1
MREQASGMQETLRPTHHPRGCPRHAAATSQVAALAPCAASWQPHPGKCRFGVVEVGDRNLQVDRRRRGCGSGSRRSQHQRVPCRAARPTTPGHQHIAHFKLCARVVLRTVSRQSGSRFKVGEVRGSRRG